MKTLNYLNNIRNDLKTLEKYQTVIFGSFLTKYFIPHRSDIDIAIITLNFEKEKNISLLKELAGEFSEKYDIKIFELLPLYLKIEIINNYRVLFGDPLDISEYFYHFRTLWRDMARRIKENQFKNITEKLESLERRSLQSQQ